MIASLLHDRARLSRVAYFALAGTVLVIGLQAATFFGRFEPRMTRAAVQLRELTLETGQRRLDRAVSVQVEALIEAAPEAEGGERTLGDAWSDFREHFGAGPQQAVAAFRDELVALGPGARVGPAEQSLLLERLEQLGDIYTEHYKDIVADLDEPPLYLWPTASVLASRTGYREAAVLNRALFLTQVGEIGTARVMLAGLNASADDPKVIGLIFYTLGRIQFELFRATPEAEYYEQSLQYLRQSLAADPDMDLAKHLLDFLLSLPLAATAPQAAEGRPEVPSEGEGAAVSAEKRIF
jgi:hypothetical protein